MNWVAVADENRGEIRHEELKKYFYAKSNIDCWSSGKSMALILEKFQKNGVNTAFDRVMK